MPKHLADLFHGVKGPPERPGWSEENFGPSLTLFDPCDAYQSYRFPSRLAAAQNRGRRLADVLASASEFSRSVEPSRIDRYDGLPMREECLAREMVRRLVAPEIALHHFSKSDADQSPPTQCYCSPHDRE
jgi:hypothetical protein